MKRNPGRIGRSYRFYVLGRNRYPLDALCRRRGLIQWDESQALPQREDKRISTRENRTLWVSPPTVRSLLDRFPCDSRPSALDLPSCSGCFYAFLQPGVSTSSFAFTTTTLRGKQRLGSTPTAERFGYGRRLCSGTRLRKAPHYRRRLCQDGSHRLSGHFRESRSHSLAAQNGDTAEALHPGNHRVRRLPS